MAGLQPIPEGTEGRVKPEPLGASNCDIFLNLVGLFGYIADVGTDLLLAYHYYSKGHTKWFLMTMIFILAPAVAMSTFSLILYILDWRTHSQKASRIRWVSRFIFLFLQLAPLLRLDYILLYRICWNVTPFFYL